MIPKPATVTGLLLAVVVLAFARLGFTPANGQVPQAMFVKVSPAMPVEHQPIAFYGSVHDDSALEVSISVYGNTTCHLGFNENSPEVFNQINSIHNGNFNVSLTAGLPVGSYCASAFSFNYESGGYLMLEGAAVSFTVSPSTPVPEFSAIEVVAFVALAASLILLRRNP